MDFLRARGGGHICPQTFSWTPEGSDLLKKGPKNKFSQNMTHFDPLSQETEFHPFCLKRSRLKSRSSPLPVAKGTLAHSGWSKKNYPGIWQSLLYEAATATAVAFWRVDVLAGLLNFFRLLQLTLLHRKDMMKFTTVPKAYISKKNIWISLCRASLFYCFVSVTIL